MSYVIAQSVGDKEASRYIHFIFFLLVISVLYSISFRNGKNLYFIPLLFLTSPVVMNISSKGNVDFQWLYCFMLSVDIILFQKQSTKNIIKSAIFFGGGLATKIYALSYQFIFAFFFVICGRFSKKSLQTAIIFIIFSLLAAAFWYIRSYLITGDPIYPVFYNYTSPDYHSPAEHLSTYFRLNTNIFYPEYFLAFSPFMLLGILFIFLQPIRWFKSMSTQITVFMSLTIILLLAVQFLFPRHIIAMYVIFSLGISASLYMAVKRFIGLLQVMYIIAFFYLAYYLVLAIIHVPYALGMADKNAYLTRVLSRDNSSYYDFDHLFDHHFNPQDLVATYNLYGFYYASFKYEDVHYIFDNLHRDARQLQRLGFSKMLIKHGNITWFCKSMQLSHCGSLHVILLAYYNPADMYLYSLK